jgi:hypothetical protein
VIAELLLCPRPGPATLAWRSCAVCVYLRLRVKTLLEGREVVLRRVPRGVATLRYAVLIRIQDRLLLEAWDVVCLWWVLAGAGHVGAPSTLHLIAGQVGSGRHPVSCAPWGLHQMEGVLNDGGCPTPRRLGQGIRPFPFGTACVVAPPLSAVGK